MFILGCGVYSIKFMRSILPEFGIFVYVKSKNVSPFSNLLCIKDLNKWIKVIKTTKLIKIR